MEQKKPQHITDELAVCRAAAWAWYQRGVGSEETPFIEELVVRRIQRVPKPSRFKLEALENSHTSKGKPSAQSCQVWEGSDAGSLYPTFIETQDSETSYSSNSLLDTYEIEMISKHFDSLAYPAADGHQHGQKLSRQGSEKSTVKKVKKKSAGFWAMRPSAVCGSSGVVEPVRLIRKHRQKT